MSFEALSEIFGLKRSMEILQLLSGEELRFTEIEGRSAASSDVVTRCLNVLETYDLIDRREENPRNVRYEITETGEKFLELVTSMSDLLDAA